MGIHRIETPRGSIEKIEDKNGKVVAELVWNPGFGPGYTDKFNSAQAVIDSEVLRYNRPFIPFDTGMLSLSGDLHTVVGSGKVIYKTPYASKMYYSPHFNFQGAPQRGAYWFEKMKGFHRDDILRSAGEVMEK